MSSTLSKLLLSFPPKETGATAVYPFSTALQRRFTVTSRFGEQYPLYRVDGKWIHLPRAVCPVGPCDMRDEGTPVQFDCTIEPRDEDQARVFAEVEAFLKEGLSGQVQAQTGFGKCLAPWEPVLMHDGSIKRTDELRPGDLLMGPDSEPREVLTISRGNGPMYRIKPTKGSPWVCNDVHVLSLRCTANCDYGTKGQIIDIPLDEWLKWPQAKKHAYKLWRCGVSFPTAQQRIDPYFLGVLLGDGSLKKVIAVTTIDPEIVTEIYRQAKHFGSKVREVPPLGPLRTYHLTGKRGIGNRCALRWELECLGLLGTGSGEKFIPRNYKIADRSQRLQLLAGLLDTDGHHIKGCFEYVSKSKQLADDVAFVARSLGLAAYIATKVVPKRIYYRVNISGLTSEIPTRLPRKQAPPRQQVKDVLNVGFTVEPLGNGDYSGVEITGDRRYLLGDFTVTHNTPLALHAIAKVGRKALIVVTKEDLLSYWVAEARKFLKLTEDEVGVIQQDKCQVVGRKVVVALIHSLSIEDRYPKEIADGFGLVVYDESQRLGAEQFSTVASMFPAKLRLALSATPDRADGKELLVQAHIGPIRARGMVEQRVPRVIRLESNWRCPRVPRRDKLHDLVELVPLPHGSGKTGVVLKHMIKDEERNQMLAELVWIGWEKQRHVVFFSDSIDHLNRIIRLVKAMGVDGKEIGKFVGGLTEKAREEAKSKRLVFTTYAMCAEGVNVPRWDYGIQGTPRSSVTQAVGRIRRQCENKPTPIWIDIIDRDSKVFASYSAKRLIWYRNIGCPVEDH